jgi:hypothetical protein
VTYRKKWNHRDDNEQPIIECFERAGARVYPVSEKDFPDLVIRVGPVFGTVEVKNPDGFNRFSDGQKTFARESRESGAPYFVASEIEDVPRIMRRMRNWYTDGRT